MRTIRYRQIAEAIREQIEAGAYGPGQVLPSEASLGRDHDASRVTVRKALELLRGEGLVESRQGFGWIVSGQLLSQSLESLQSIESQLARVGRAHERQILDFRFIDADGVDSKADVGGALGQRVLEVRRVSRVDDRPFARVTVWCAEELAQDLTLQNVSQASFYDLLQVEATTASQTISAEPVSADDAELLEVPVGTAALVVRRTTFDGDNQPMLMAEHVFPGHLTEFNVELAGSGEAATGSSPTLRLVADP